MKASNPSIRGKVLTLIDDDDNEPYLLIVRIVNNVHYPVSFSAEMVQSASHMLEKDIENGLILDYQRKDGMFEVINTSDVKDICKKVSRPVFFSLRLPNNPLFTPFRSPNLRLHQPAVAISGIFGRDNHPKISWASLQNILLFVQCVFTSLKTRTMRERCFFVLLKPN